MAKTKTIVRTKAPTVSKKKYELARRTATAAAQRSRRVATERFGTLVGCATAFGVGRYESNGKKLPSFGGVEGTALWGGALAFGPSLLGFGSGKLGNVAAEVGASLLGVACYKAGKKIAPIVGGDDGEWE
jgi:hypothetical protein